MTEYHRSTVDASGASVTSGYVPKADGSGNVVWAAEAGGGALDDLTDVTITAPSDGEVLTYDNGTSEWVNAAPTGGVDELSELLDVNLDYLDDGDFLTYDEASGLWITTGAPSGTVPDGTDPGDILAWDGAAWDVLPIGADDEVLTADSGETLGVKWAAATGGGALVLLEQHTASSSASLDFTTCISSTYDEYMIEIVGILPATNAVNLTMEMGTGAGPTYDSGTNYLGNSWQFDTNGNGGYRALNTPFEIGNSHDNTAAGGCSGTVRLYNPNPGTKRPHIIQQHGRLTTGLILSGSGSGSYISTTAITAFRFLFSSGNIASGTIRCYGVAKT